MSKKNLPPPKTKEDKSKKFVNQKKISTEKAIKINTERIAVKRNKS